jgi:hypothetical protein
MVVRKRERERENLNPETQQTEEKDQELRSKRGEDQGDLNGTRPSGCTGGKVKWGKVKGRV